MKSLWAAADRRQEQNAAASAESLAALQVTAKASFFISMPRSHQRSHTRPFTTWPRQKIKPAIDSSALQNKSRLAAKTPSGGVGCCTRPWSHIGSWNNGQRFPLRFGHSLDTQIWDQKRASRLLPGSLFIANRTWSGLTPEKGNR